MEKLPLSRIKRDKRAQPRAQISETIIAEYLETIRGGVYLPPLRVFYDGDDYWLADGFHRIEARSRNEERFVECSVEPGGLRDAILYSCKANATHGVRRSDDDKRRAVLTLLEDEEWGRWSDRTIAGRCGVSHPFVARIRQEQAAHLETLPDRPRTAARGDGAAYKMKTANIGRNSSAKPSAPATPAKRDSTWPPVGAVEPHSAIRVLAQSIVDVGATPQEIVSGCKSTEDRCDLRDACEPALTKLEAVVRELDITCDTSFIAARDGADDDSIHLGGGTLAAQGSDWGVK